MSFVKGGGAGGGGAPAHGVILTEGEDGGDPETTGV
jgi:hypothetical protein